MTNNSTPRRPKYGHSQRRLLIEPLEERQLLSTISLVDDTFEVRQNAAWQTLPVLDNDALNSLPTGQPVITSVSYGSEGGRVEISESGKAVSYAPPADFAGTEQFVYFVNGLLSAKVTVKVVSPLEPDRFTVLPTGTSHTLPVMANDPFWSDYGGNRRVTYVSETALGGEVQVTDDGQSVRYTPPAHDYGQDSFIYVVDARYPAEVKLDLPNPLQDDRFREVIQNSQNTAPPVLANDIFWSGYQGSRTITAVTSTAQDGTVSVSNDGQTLSYTPRPDFVGWDDFRYVVDNIYEATVRIQVQRPVGDDAFELDTGSVGVPLLLTDNDSYTYYDGSWITRDVVDRVTSVSETAAGGVVTILDNGQGVWYSAPADFEGVDTFSYEADGQHSAQVTVHVTRPVRDDFLLQVYEDTIGNPLDVLANDFKGNGYDGPGIITAVSAPTQGGVVRIASGGRSLEFDPRAGFRGTDAFTYTVDDLFEARVQVQVSRLTSSDYETFCPLVPGAGYSLDVLGNDHFQQNYPGPALITEVSTPAGGDDVTIAGNGKSLAFVPLNGGSASFTYVVDGRYEESVSVRIRSHLVADEFRVDQNREQSIVDPLANDFQPANYGTTYYCGVYQGPRQITSVGQTTQGGTVTILDGKRLQYTPGPDFVGDDQFSYTVDGTMQATATVHVIRRVRDDSFHVAPDSEQQSLPVLVNDLLGADYRGAGQISHVTATVAGAQAAISADGTAILYTPPQGFQGEDTLTYTVDGVLKAEVTVTVRNSEMDRWPGFTSIADVGQYLLDRAVTRYEDLFGQESHGWLAGGVAYDTLPMASGAGQERSHSETNVQVAGVDEGDIVETDGDCLYILTETELVVAAAWPAEDMAVLSRTAIEGSAVAEYLQGERLTVVSRTFINPWPEYRDLSSAPSAPDLWYPWPPSSETWLTVFDVSDPTAPQVVQKTLLDGTYVESRRIDDLVFVVLQNGPVELPMPRPLPVTDAETNVNRYVYETRDQYSERMLAEIGQQIESLLPAFTSYDGDGTIVRTGLLNSPEELLRPISEDDVNLMSVVSLDVTNNEPGISGSTGVFTGNANKIYGSRDHLYVFGDQYSTEDGTVTRILKFDWDATNGQIVLAARGLVAGRMLNQFSVDENGDYLRVVTTLSNRSSGNYSDRSESVLFVLQDDDGLLEFVSSLKNFGLDESVRSVRFFDERVFITTYRDVDPLLAVDLSDPESPALVGHLTLPGFNSYVQPIDAYHLLTVGRNTPAGASGPTQVSLIDVRDLTQPHLLDQYTFARFSTSEAELDHHAFGWFAEHQMLAVPTARSYWQRSDEDGDGYSETRRWTTEYALGLFGIDVASSDLTPGTLTFQGEIQHESPVRRSAFIEDVLYSVAAESTIAVDIHAPEHVYAEIQYPAPVVPPTSGDGNAPRAGGQLVLDMVDLAKDNLADTHGILRSQIVGYTVEFARWQEDTLLVDADRNDAAAIPGYRIVLDTGSQQYLYHTNQDSTVRLADESFEFQPPEHLWYNAAVPLDVNGDSRTTPRDALIVINELHRRGSRPLVAERVERAIHVAHTYLFDVNNDGYLAPRDALQIINWLNEHRSDIPSGEGEATPTWPALPWLPVDHIQPTVPADTEATPQVRESANADPDLPAPPPLGPYPSVAEVTAVRPPIPLNPAAVDDLFTALARLEEREK